jgi:aryl-alcohol dehydrogenase-like predicted oxidoreductase
MTHQTSQREFYSMSQRELGTSGLTVSAIGLGCMGMSQSYGPGDEAESIRTLNRAIDIGVTFLDTAAAYGLGANERLLSRVLATRRAEVVLATKCGIVRTGDGKATVLDGSPAEITRSCEESLQRLGVDVIDLFYLHRVDPNVPIEESVGAMATLVHAGKVRYLGLSEAGPSTLKRAHDVHAIAALQSEYSLWWREPEESVLPACRRLGIGFVPFSPLGRGFLSGTVTATETLSNDDMRKTLPRFQGENLDRNLALVAHLEKIAAAKHCTASQLALAWLLAQGSDIVPIPGTKRRTYLESNAAAVNIRLTEDERRTLDQAFPPNAVAGDRYPPEMMRWVDRA